MGFFKGSFKLCRRFLVMFFVIYANAATSDRIPYGIVFDQKSEEMQEAFKVAVFQLTNPKVYADFQVYVDVINTADVFKLSRLICNQFGRGVLALVAAVNPDSFDTFHSYANTFHMPFVTPFYPEKILPSTADYKEYAVSILPDYHKAIIDMVMYYGWNSVVIMYDSPKGILRMQRIFNSLIPGKEPFFRITLVKRFSTAAEVIESLRQLEKADRWGTKYIILDCSTSMAKEILIRHVRDVQLGRRNYHYLFSNLILDDYWEPEIKEFGAVNFTGFQIIDTSRKVVKEFLAHWPKKNISAQAALLYDTTFVTAEGFRRISRKNADLLNKMISSNRSRILSCDKHEPEQLTYGKTIIENIKQTRVDGLSGLIRLNENGLRKDYSLQVMQNTPSGHLVKVGTWYDRKGLVAVRPRQKPLDVSGKYDRNKTYTVLSMNEAPYFMVEKIEAEIKNENVISYEGFCVDLAELIADKLEIKIVMRSSRDGQYGKENPNVDGNWDGIIGELVRKEADMAVAPLIVTRKREAAVDFSRPFLSFNLKTTKKNEKEATTLFFLKPLASETWYLLIASIFGVTIVLYLVTRFSPSEWKVVSVTETSQGAEQTENAETKTTVINEFSLFNSFWYSLGSLMQQGSDIAPRSLSGRIVSVVWWFFTVIIVASYTANMMRYLILSGIETPKATEYNKLANCPEDLLERKQTVIDDEIHGNGEGSFLELMLMKPKVVQPVTDCEMIVSINGDGTKEFAVALPKGSKLRVGVNVALVALKEEGELARLMRKWFTKNMCSVLQTDSTAGTELTLEHISGLFYVLFSGMAVSLVVGLFEFCAYRLSKAGKAKIPIKTALRAKSRLGVTEREETPATRCCRREQDETVWNERSETPGTYAGLQAPFEAKLNRETMTLRGRRRPAAPNSPNMTMPKRAKQQNTRQNVIQEMQETSQAVAYFTPTSQSGHDEIALRESFTQV